MSPFQETIRSFRLKLSGYFALEKNTPKNFDSTQKKHSPSLGSYQYVPSSSLLELAREETVPSPSSTDYRTTLN